MRTTLRRLVRRAVPILPFAVVIGCTDAPTPLAPAIPPTPNALLAATVTVTNTDDDGPGSLRQAVTDAAAGSTIQFDAAVAGQTIVLSTGQIVIDKVLIIEGPASVGMTISGGMSSRIFNVFPDGNATFRNVSLVNGNEQTFGGGGGAIWVNGIAVLDHVLVANNQTGNTGGGIFVKSSGQLTLINSTVSGNTGPLGGAIASGGSVTLWNSTITNNTGSQTGGVWIPDGALYLRNSIIANNVDSDDLTTVDNCLLGATASVLYQGANLASDAGCGPAASVVVADPKLGPLASNGGPTKTHALTFESPAIDLGTACSEATDQRYITRNQGASCDAGAFEFTDFGTFTFTIGPNASINAKTGVATVSGTIKCSRPGSATLHVSLSQTQKTTGRFATIIQASADVSVASCGTSPSSWTTTLTPASGKFENGTASAAITTVTFPRGFLAGNASANVKVFVVK